MKYNWKTLDQKDDLLNTLLFNRGVKTVKQKKEYLNPRHPNDLTLKELGINSTSVKKATSRINKAKKNKERVLVFGDYDADGICATAILWECLYDLGLIVDPFIPDRFSEGYGLSIKGIKNIFKKNPDLKLIITVDNGISAIDAINFANKNGIDVIITDHHQKPAKLPNAHSIIHTTKISGSGVAWILAREVSIWKKGLDLAAIATITDQLPLLGPNRSFVIHGLKSLRKTKRPGVISLLMFSQVVPKNISEHEINYVIGPHLNAMGRLESAMDSLRLLCTKDPKRANSLAEKIIKVNLKRRELVSVQVDIALNDLKKNPQSGIIILDGSYHEGIIGLIAGRLSDVYNQPAIVISKGKTESKASARSVEDFDIISALQKTKKLLTAVGGHPMAAGFSIENKNINKFTTEINKLYKAKKQAKKTLSIDSQLEISDINWKTYDKIQKLAPFGNANPKPLFTSNNLEIFNAKLVGSEQNHLKLTVKNKSQFIDCIAFGLGSYYDKLLGNPNLSLAYNLEENSWNNKKTLQLKIKDIKVS